MLVLAMTGCGGGSDPETFQEFHSSFTAEYVWRCEELKCFPITHETLQPTTDCETLSSTKVDIFGDCSGFDPAAGGACLDMAEEWSCDPDVFAWDRALDVGVNCDPATVCP